MAPSTPEHGNKNSYTSESWIYKFWHPTPSSARLSASPLAALFTCTNEILNSLHKSLTSPTTSAKSPQSRALFRGPSNWTQQVSYHNDLPKVQTMSLPKTKTTHPKNIILISWALLFKEKYRMCLNAIIVWLRINLAFRLMSWNNGSM